MIVQVCILEEFEKGTGAAGGAVPCGNKMCQVQAIAI